MKLLTLFEKLPRFFSTAIIAGENTSIMSATVVFDVSLIVAPSIVVECANFEMKHNGSSFNEALVAVLRFYLTVELNGAVTISIIETDTTDKNLFLFKFTYVEE